MNIEDLLESLYWEFDAERNKKHRSERDIFKGKIRWLVYSGILHETAEDNSMMKSNEQ